MRIPRPEHPRPQFYRDSWQNLNGKWDFDFDFGDSKKEQGWASKTDLPMKITVPFCPESSLSGINNKDFMDAVWYHKEILLTKEQLSGRVLIHFGAVDYHCEVFVNGVSAGTHDGGYTSFEFDITDLVNVGSNHVNVYASDHSRTGNQPYGKQSERFASYGCMYTRTTGIWQTVWLEFVPDTYITYAHITPDPDNGSAAIRAVLNKAVRGKQLIASAALNGTTAGITAVKAEGSTVDLTLSVSDIQLWEPGSPVLYDLQLALHDGETTIDSVQSYFGLRKVTLSDGAILINGKPVFQRLVLDQGFYPDGIYTAPSDDALRHDIELSMAMGFNGARFHEKVFEERSLYWADKLGYLVWGEHPNWGLNISVPDALCIMLPAWLEEIRRDYNHPALVGWCPFNETWDYAGRKQDDRVLACFYDATKSADPTRPVIDTSGNFHVKTDIFDIHDYEQEPRKFAEHYPLDGELYNNFPQRQTRHGEPYFVSEYGGTWWNPAEAAVLREQASTEGWGYGQRPLTEEEAAHRIASLTKTLLDNPGICAFCYTQLTDVEQEQNGMFTYERKPKFSDAMYKVIRSTFSAPAAIENKNNQVQ